MAHGYAAPLHCGMAGSCARRLPGIRQPVSSTCQHPGQAQLCRLLPWRLVGRGRGCAEGPGLHTPPHPTPPTPLHLRVYISACGLIAISSYRTRMTYHLLPTDGKLPLQATGVGIFGHLINYEGHCAANNILPPDISPNTCRLPAARATVQRLALCAYAYFRRVAQRQRSHAPLYTPPPAHAHAHVDLATLRALRM